ncbi:MAG TPA: thioredoxin domain-containing protein [Gemmatimonadaceae bacterium]|jgi:protein-disulfide isomerase
MLSRWLSLFRQGDLMRNRVEGVISALLALAAIAIAASVVRRSFFPQSQTVEALSLTRPQFLPAWKDALPIGISIGDSAAPVKIVELTDLECPACRGFQSTLLNVVQAHPRDVSIVYVSNPLSMHRFALPAARGAECAVKYGKFREWVQLMYDKQDSLGLKSWGSYALEAGIPDSAAITRCATDPSPVDRIEAGLAFGAKIHILGTPTVIVNGWRFPSPPTEQELSDAVEALAKGAAPFDTTAK